MGWVFLLITIEARAFAEEAAVPAMQEKVASPAWLAAMAGMKAEAEAQVSKANDLPACAITERMATFAFPKPPAHCKKTARYLRTLQTLEEGVRRDCQKAAAWGEERLRSSRPTTAAATTDESDSCNPIVQAVHLASSADTEASIVIPPKFPEFHARVGGLLQAPGPGEFADPACATAAVRGCLVWERIHKLASHHKMLLNRAFEKSCKRGDKKDFDEVSAYLTYIRTGGNAFVEQALRERDRIKEEK